LSIVKLNIDFTKLAKIAFNKNKNQISNFLINHEKQIVKKIPFLLEVNQHEKALSIAIQDGDPNNINKVLSEIFTKTAPEKAMAAIIEVPDSLRHLRNFAKNRNNATLL